MNRKAVCDRIRQIGIIPAIRVSSSDDALFAAEAISDSGIPIIEITMTVPGAVEVIRKLAHEGRDLIVGAGTVVNEETARRCVGAGALFLTSPGLDHSLVEFAARHDVAVLPGALTPTEIMAAWKAGSDFVKVFPCSVLGGAGYISALKSPFPQVPLIAAGGVNQQSAADLIHAGAVAIGVGRELIHPDAIEKRERGWIRELAGRYLKMVVAARNGRDRHKL